MLEHYLILAFPFLALKVICFVQFEQLPSIPVCQIVPPVDALFEPLIIMVWKGIEVGANR